MENKFKLKLLRVCVPLTMKCQLHCKYCYRDAGRIDHVPDFTEDMKEYLSQLDPSYCEAVIASGGEPLLAYNKMMTLFESTNKAIHKKIMTNGMLLTEDLVKYINDNDIELYLSYDGKQSGFLRGYDVLSDKSKCNLIKKINDLEIHSVITKYNTDIMDNYSSIVYALDGRMDFRYTISPINDVSSECKKLIDDFNYTEMYHTRTEFMKNYFRMNKHSRGSTCSIDLSSNDSIIGYVPEFNLLPNGDAVGMTYITTTYGTIYETRETIINRYRENHKGMCQTCVFDKYCDICRDKKTKHICKSKWLSIASSVTANNTKKEGIQ